jgi:hypothetical protein
LIPPDAGVNALKKTKRKLFWEEEAARDKRPDSNKWNNE